MDYFLTEAQKKLKEKTRRIALFLFLILLLPAISYANGYPTSFFNTEDIKDSSDVGSRFISDGRLIEDIVVLEHVNWWNVNLKNGEKLGIYGDKYRGSAEFVVLDSVRDICTKKYNKIVKLSNFKLLDGELSVNSFIVGCYPYSPVIAQTTRRREETILLNSQLKKIESYVKKRLIEYKGSSRRGNVKADDIFEINTEVIGGKDKTIQVYVSARVFKENLGKKRDYYTYPKIAAGFLLKLHEDEIIEE
ncbi:MAG: hypothetical protein MUO85_03050, partial [candidate division Zixibacteria bacterium]|nr:hypothetical protein [candidate division Zixibacteria bacterium]